MGIFCHHCDCVIRGGLDDFAAHLNLRGHNAPYFCHEGDCGELRLEHKRSYIRHLNNFHLEDIHSTDTGDEDESAEDESAEDEQNCNQESDAEHHEDMSIASNETEDAGEEQRGEEQHQTDEGLEKIAARYLMDLKKNGNVTDVAIDTVVKETTTLLAKVLIFAQEKIRAKLNQKIGQTVDETLIEHSLDIFMGDPFYRLQTKDERLSYYTKFFGYIPPESMFTGKFRYESRFDKKKKCSIQKQIPCNFQNVSMIETLTAIVNNPILFKLIFEEKRSTDGKLRSYLDAEKGRNHPFLAKYPHTIRMNLHGDDYECVNAEGSKTSFHKIVALQFMIQNLPPEENARLRALHLLSYAYRADMTPGQGIDILLEPIFKELEKLSSDEGVPILACGNPFILRAIIVCGMGDAAAAHEMLGLMPPSAGCFCWLCTVNRKELHANIFASGEKRTPERHESHLKAIEEFGAAAQKYYGIERRAALITRLEHASFPEAFIRDCFHDILKGIGPMEIKLSLHEYVGKRKYFDAEFLNARLSSFLYGPADVKNKPSANFSDKSLSTISSYGLRQSGAQTWLFIQVFPFLFGNKIPADDPHMKLIVLLKRMCEIIFSPVLSASDIEVLETLIFKHHSLFSLLYPPIRGEEAENEENHEEMEEHGEEEDEEEVDDPGEQRTEARQQAQHNFVSQRKKKVVRPINKHHHILEYPEIIRQFGPLVHYWCMRMEGKNALPERYATICGNFKDLPLTLADLHQTKHAADFMDWTCSVQDEIKLSRRQVTSVQDIGHRDAFLLAGIEGNAVIEKLASVTIGGFEYTPDRYVVLPIQENSMPVFGHILFPFRADDKLFIACENTNLVSYDHKYGAYHIENSIDEALRVWLLKDLPPCRPISAWTPYESSSLYLSPRTSTLSDFIAPEDA